MKNPDVFFFPISGKKPAKKGKEFSIERKKVTFTKIISVTFKSVLSFEMFTKRERPFRKPSFKSCFII